MEASGVVNAYNPQIRRKAIQEHVQEPKTNQAIPGKTLSQKITEIRTQKHSNTCPKNKSSQKKTIPNHHQMISEHNIYLVLVTLLNNLNCLKQIPSRKKKKDIKEELSKKKKII